MPNYAQGSVPPPPAAAAASTATTTAASMEERHAQILRFHRSKFAQSVEVERLFPMLRPSVLSQADVGEIEQQAGPPARVHKLLDLLPGRGSQAFKMLCLALETTYPHLLTVMFLGSDSVSLSAVGKGSSQSTVSSYTSESDVDDPRSPRLLLPSGQQNGHSAGNRSLEFFKPDQAMKQSGEHVERIPPSPLASRTESATAMTSAAVMTPATTTAIALRGTSDGSASPASIGDERVGLPSHRSVEQLQSDCKRALLQLESRQQVDAAERLEQARREAERWRGQSREAAESAEQLRQELRAKTRESAELAAAWEQAERRAEDLRQTHEDDLEELAELRRQNREALDRRGSSEVLNKMYDTAWDRYERLKREHEVLKQRQGELASRHSLVGASLERAEEDNGRLRGQLDSAWAERDQVQAERHSLRQQCTAVIRKYDEALREVDELLQARRLADQRGEESRRELGQLRRLRRELDKKLELVAEERNAAVREYALVMSERDDVHKEMEKLQEEAQAEAERRKAAEGKHHNILTINDALKGKMYFMSKERDQALREYNELSDRYRDIISNTALAQKERDMALFEFEKFKEERDVARRERTEALDQRDKLLQECYNAVQQHKSISYDCDLACREAQGLRRSLDTAEKELKEVQSETDDAKRQRDRAFQERVKIMMERESIRTLCDKLRRERDRAVSDFAEALRNLDDVKRQRNDAVKQLKDAKDKLQKQSEKAMHTGMKKLITHQSRDSAIDADSQEWETETVAIETEREDGDVSVLGFDFGDSKDNKEIPDDCSLIITKVDKGSLADGRLKVNDYVLRVNDIDLTNGDRSVALQAVKKARGVINMVVKRRRSSGAKFCPVTLFLTSKDHGVSLESGIFVSRVDLGSISAKECGLMVGDRLVSVNGESVVNKCAQDVEQMLDTLGEAITLNVMRVSSPSSSSGLPSNASPTAESIKSHETLSSKSSLTPLLGPPGDEAGSGRTISVQTEAGVALPRPPALSPPPPMARQSDPARFEDKVIENPHFRGGDGPAGVVAPPEWPSGVQEPLPYPVRRPHANSEPSRRAEGVVAWEAGHQHQSSSSSTSSPCHKEGVWTYPQQSHSRQSSQDFSPRPGAVSGDDAPRDGLRRSREGSFVESSHSRQSSRESSGRHSGHHASHSSRESFRETKRPNGYDHREQDAHNPHGSKDSPYCSPPPAKRGSGHKKQDSKENYPPPQQANVGPPQEYKTSPAVGRVRRERDGSPRVDPYTEQGDVVGGEFYRAGHAEKPEHSTWPKSRGPPEVYLTNRKWQNRITTIPLMNPSRENVARGAPPGSGSSAGETGKADPEMVPPKPPSRNSSLKASKRHKRSSSTSAGAEPRGGPQGASDSSPPQLRGPLGQANSVPLRGGAGPLTSCDFNSGGNMNNNSQSAAALPTAHYPTGSLPDTSLDYSVASGQPVAKLRPGSSPSVAQPLPPPAAEARRAIQRRAQRPAQLQLAVALPGAHPAQPQSAPAHPSQAHVVRLASNVPYFKVHSKALGGSSGPGQPPLYLPAYAASTHSVSSSSSSSSFAANPHEDERSPSRSSLPATPRDFHSEGRRYSNQSFDFDQPTTQSSSQSLSQRGPYVNRQDGYYTFPKKTEKRIRLSSNLGLSPEPCLSTSSVEKGSVSSSVGSRDNQASVSLHSSLSVSSSGRSSVSSFSEPEVNVTRGSSGSSTRIIEIEKSNEPLGIRIIRGNRGGIFVHAVTMGSLAARAELHYGDQILEFNGLNLRQATYDQAAMILSQAGNSISMLVMDNASKVRDSMCDSEDQTPTSSPGSTRTNSPLPSRPQSEVCSDAGTMTPPTPRASRIYPHNTPKVDSLPSPSEPRFVFLEKSGNSLGVGVFGGNAVGIFVYEVQPGGVAAEPNGLRVGDQILEFNGVDLRSATAEQAAMELQKPTEKVTILAQHNIGKFGKIQDQRGDAVYVRAMVDYQASGEDRMSFRRDDIMYVDDTMHNGVLGLWSAWLLDGVGKKLRNGQVPSKAVLQKDQARKRSISQGLQEEELRSASSRRNAGPARRSLFRRKKHQRNNSDSKEPSEGSASDVPIQEEAVLPTYIRVEPLDFHIKRPVILLGPLTDRVAAKMVDESPDKFNRCLPKVVRTSSEIMLKDLADNVYVDYQRRDSHFECIHSATVKEITKKGCHCILDGVSPYATERLQILQLFPIVIFIRYKSAKQIKDQKDSHYIPDRVSHRLAKEMFEQAQKLEQECRSMFSDIVAGGNLASICTKVKKVIDREQRKTVWVQSMCPL